MTLTLLPPLLALVMGLAAVVRPEPFARATGLVAVGALGRSELRAVFGGVFVGLGAACLVLAAPAAYWAAGAAFLGGAAAKLASGVADRGAFPAALPGLVVDLVLGGLFVWGGAALVAAS